MGRTGSNALFSRALAAMLALCGAGFAFGAWKLGLWMDGGPDAGLLPFAAALLLLLFSLGAVIAPLPETPDPIVWRRLSCYLAAGLVFCVLPPLAGAMLAFTAGLVLMLHVGEGLPPLRSLAVSLTVSVAATLLFRQVLGVPLPDPLLDLLGMG